MPKGNLVDRMLDELESGWGAKITGLVIGRNLELQKTSSRWGTEEMMATTNLRDVGVGCLPFRSSKPATGT